MKFEELEQQIEELEQQIDVLEDNGKNETSSEWMAIWKQVVQLNARKYKIAFPDSEIEINEDGTQFRVL